MGVKMNWEIRIEVVENGDGGEAALQFIEGRLGLMEPMKSLALSKKVRNVRNNAWKAVNESAVEVGEAKKNLNVMNVFGHQPLSNGGDTVRVHGNAWGWNDKAKEGYCGDMELIFLSFAW